MNKPLLAAVLITTSLIAGTAFAEDDCKDPVANWQPREVLRQQLEEQGWKISRIKVDDGCYEVKGYDQLGNKVKAEYFPASLRLRKLKIKFTEDATIPDWIPSSHPKALSTSNIPNKKAQPKVSIE
ncbi:PepSY domain-containing protein [Marinospirillum insulare]|uniref:PepSY domain-containing protein n=1 Tax=Marinospirillum insulare TaxID=217169 RepID=A0ABQ5ZXQ2_9GAMM|nr:PepSY domain-containing protein [Marinospirillum insulare]GLR62763.1 hypothetical protein GCM10007878_01980 [Marinospirillum insulare]